MRFVYAIIAHDAFDQLERLIHRLLADAPDDRVCLHIDAKTSCPPAFLNGLDPAIRDRVVRVSPVPVLWAHWSQCAAIERLLDAALTTPFDMMHLISGRDWPLCSRDEMVSAVAETASGACFVDIADNCMAWRMNDWCLFDRHLRPPVAHTPISWRVARARRSMLRQGNAALRSIGIRRTEPLGAWVKGSQWWSLPIEAAGHVRDAIRATRSSGRLRFTECSDEHVVQTALVNGGFVDRIVPARRMVVFPDGAASPRLLTAADLAERPATTWFGRKFDMAVDPTFLDL